MRFYRLLLALFLIVFMGKFCVAQSWDWVVSSKYTGFNNNLHVSVGENGEAYILHAKSNNFFSSSDSVKHKNEILTKIDNSGRRIRGADIWKSNVDLREDVKLIQVKDNIIYILLCTSNTVEINGKAFSKPIEQAGHSAKKNIILVKLDTSLRIKSTKLLGWIKHVGLAGIHISPSHNVYVSFSTSAEDDSLYLCNRIYYKTKSAEFTLAIDSSANFLWDRKNIGSNIAFDKAGNFWVSKYGQKLKASFVKVGSNGVDIDSIVIDGLAYLNPYIDNDENVFLVGYTRDIVQLPGGLILGGDSKSLLIKYNKNLQFQWYRSSTGFKNRLFSMQCDKAGNIYLCGNMPDAEPQSFTFAGLTIYLNQYSYCLKLDKSGNGIWVDYPKTTGSSVGMSSLYKDDCDNIYIGGGFSIIGFDYRNNFAIGKQITPLNISEKGLFLAKLNPDKLEFEAEETCGGIYLKNTSDSIAYTLLEWIMPDGTKHFSRDAYIENNKYNDTFLVSLKGIKANGCENVITQKLFEQIPKPFAKFTTDSFVGCQWVGMRFHNLSTKTGEIRCADCEGVIWDFGDGEKSNSWGPKVEHVYTKPGNYKISLQYWIAPCSDTFTLEKQITIMEAPKPGFTVNLTEGCAPLTVNITDQSAGQVETYFYTSGDGQTSNQPSPTFIYTKPGKYFITQYLKGPTECITKDSVQITIRAGYSQTTEPELLTATVTDSHYVKVSWKKNPVTATYKLHRQSANSAKTFQLQSTDTFYIDKDVDVNKAFYSYALYGTDSCANTKQAANIAQTILLENHSQTTEYNYLRWSPYQSWQNGVKDYKLQYKTDADFADINTFPGHINEYKDGQLYPAETKQICYKIIATENAGNKQQSQSNTVCMPFLPTIIVPNAFSPNNDSINDIFSISVLGIESYHLTIYNRWGEKIYTGTQHDKGWDGKFKHTLAPQGIYIYKLSAKAYNGSNIHRSGNVHLLP